MNIKNTWPLWVAAAFLFLALGHHPYSYYQVLRWLVCVASVYTAYQAYEMKQSNWTWVFAIIAVLFNPIAPITFARDTWQLLDVVAGALFIARAVLLNKHLPHSSR